MRDTVIFDIGGVLIDWNPRHLYHKLFDDEAAMEHFLAEVCSPLWNAEQDAGRPFAAATAAAVAEHPEHREMIEQYFARWPEMMAGTIDGTVDVLAELRARRVPLYALSNWSAETYPMARERFDFFDWFDGIVVSGEEGVMKPDPRIYAVLQTRYGVTPERAVFVDDSKPNVAMAEQLGLHPIHFTAPPALRAELGRLGLL